MSMSRDTIRAIVSDYPSKVVETFQVMAAFAIMMTGLVVTVAVVLFPSALVYHFQPSVFESAIMTVEGGPLFAGLMIIQLVWMALVMAAVGSVIENTMGGGA